MLVKVEQRSKEKDRFECPYEIVGKVHDRGYRMKNNIGKVIERNVEKIKRFFKVGEDLYGGCYVVAMLKLCMLVLLCFILLCY